MTVPTLRHTNLNYPCLRVIWCSSELRTLRKGLKYLWPFELAGRNQRSVIWICIQPDVNTSLSADQVLLRRQWEGRRSSTNLTPKGRRRVRRKLDGGGQVQPGNAIDKGIRKTGGRRMQANVITIQKDLSIHGCCERATFFYPVSLVSRFSSNAFARFQVSIVSSCWCMDRAYSLTLDESVICQKGDDIWEDSPSHWHPAY